MSARKPELRLVRTDQEVDMSRQGRGARKKVESAPPPGIRVGAERESKRPSDATIHVLVPPEEKEAFLEWVKECEFASLKDAVRWLMWYARTQLHRGDVSQSVD